MEAYDYRDENGELLFQAVRFEPKLFRQRRPDGQGGWMWNLKDTRRVLYRLPDLQGKKTVYIVEGEKDADRLWSLGIPATSNPLGAGDGKWREEYTEQLKAAGVERVAVVPDNDEPGEKHATEVAASCFRAGFQTKLVRFPGFEEGGDVSDWLNAGHTMEELAKIVQGTSILLVRPELPAEKKKRESKPKNSKDAPPQYTAKADGLIDVAEEGGKPVFLVKDAEGQVSIEKQIEVDGVTYEPPPKDQIPCLLPRASEIIRHFGGDKNEALYLDLVEYHKGISELPGEHYYHLLAAWDMHTYVLEQVRFSPYIWFYAVAERGKSRTGNAAINVAYRGFTTESLREAHLIRTPSRLGGSLFIDCTNLWKKAEKHGVDDVLLNRFERGAKVPRVEHPDRGAFRDTTYYEIFGPTIIATNQPVIDVLESRAIQIVMEPTSKIFEEDVTPESALALKERLTAFRARHLGE
ncbi:MAG: toprim domain-containing protein, partial [Nitrospinota bacterium]